MAGSVLDAAHPGRPPASPPNAAGAPAPAAAVAPEVLERPQPAAPQPPVPAPQRPRAESREGAEVAPHQDHQDLAATAEMAETEVQAADATVLQKSAPRTGGLAAAAAPPGPDALARARAERDRLVREALRPGAPLLAQRRALEAAAAVMRAGGGAADHALLAARADVYLARVSDPAEQERVRDLVKALAPR